MNFSTKLSFFLTALLFLLSAISRAETATPKLGAEIFLTQNKVMPGKYAREERAGVTTIQLDGFSQYYSVDKNQLTFASACAGVFCAGDKVAHMTFGVSLATVKAANPETKKVTVEFDAYPGTYATYDSSKLTRGVPRAEQMKVYHTAYTAGAGSVIASNPETKYVTVMFDGNPNYFTYGRDNLTYSKGCVNKICVGDRVKQAQNEHLYAVAVGVNPVSNNVTVRFMQLGTFYTFPASTITVTTPAEGIPANDPRR